MQFDIRGKYLVIYYAVLLLVMMSWTDYNSFPPMMLRIFYLLAVFAPGLLDKNGLVPAALTCFWGIAVNGYAYSYMPTQVFLYVGMLVLSLFLIHRYDKPSMVFRGYLFPVVFCLYVSARNIMETTSVENLTWALLLFVIFPLFMSDRDDTNERKMSWAFMVMTSVLSFYCFTTQELFAGQYGIAGTETASRSGWTDPNYLSMVVGMGAVIGFRNLLRIRMVDRTTGILSMVAFFMAVPAMLLLVSRGGLLCLCGSIATLMAFSDIKKRYKLGAISFIVVFLVILYTNDFLTMLEDRMESGGGGSNDERLWILQHRFEAFFDSTPLYWLFGYGMENGMHLGLPYKMGSHNDYVSFMAEYGLVGLVMFLGILALPFYNMKKNSKVWADVMAYTVYIFLACLTLEPFAFGVWVYYIFLLFIIVVVRGDIARQRNERNKEGIAALVGENIDKFKNTRQENHGTSVEEK